MTVYDFAKDIIQNTDTTLFITGRAGTGKTTLLKYVAESSRKNIAIVAPTGIAAMNASGVTIHSFFKLPFTPFIPSVLEARKLIAGQKMTSGSQSVLKNVDMIIIDEVSMLRADLLDAIDVVLRHYRHSSYPFGGVQMVFFGDLYQLPPVCVNDEWYILNEYYDTPFFFSAKVFSKVDVVCLELDRIFRQNDGTFVELLNQVRDNRLSDENYNLLNSRYMPDFDLAGNTDYVVLTTHNAIADGINESRLADIEEESFGYNAVIQGDFPEYLFPVEKRIVLKKGARVMFTANDHINPSRLFYNGKIGTVSGLEDGKVCVLCDGEDEPVTVPFEVWENNTYTYNRKDNSVEVKTAGTFTQLPLRLAWAITIHKSQGLTFSKVAIDAINSFSSGQVYVALSRCTSLEGVVLLSPISRNSIIVDSRVRNFSKNNLNVNMLGDFVKRKKQETLCNSLINLFSFNLLEGAVMNLLDFVTLYRNDFSDHTYDMVDVMKNRISEISAVGNRFAVQLKQIIREDDMARLFARVIDAKRYFINRLEDFYNAVDLTDVSTKIKDRADKFSKLLYEVYFLTRQSLFVMKKLDEEPSVEQFYVLRHAFSAEKVKFDIYEEDKEADTTVIEDSEVSKLIFNELIKWRNALSKEMGVPSYMIFKKDALMEMARKMPDSMDKIMKIKGVGKVKANKYGQQCIDIIQSFNNALY